LAKAKKETSQAFLAIDAKNEHDDSRCLKLVKLAAEYNMTLNSLGFGDNWNQDILEKDCWCWRRCSGSFSVRKDAADEFGRLFTASKV